MVARHRFLTTVATLGASLAAAGAAQAQTPPPTNLVSVCSGVSLPRSAVTDIMGPVIAGVATPLQNNINAVLGVVPVVPPLTINTTGLLANAAAGQPIRLQVLNANGVLVGPGDPCAATADSLSLTAPAGVSIGGNSITGLGAAGQAASAGALDAVAIGNLATTDPQAAGAIAIGAGANVAPGGSRSLALGAGASVTTVNSVALGANSVASRGVAEVSVGAPGAERLITNVAAGTAPTDAANLGQVTAVAGDLATLAGRTVVYDGPARDRVTLSGAAGTILSNIAPGVVSSTSTEAINGAQLAATNQAVAANTTTLNNLSLNVSSGSASPVRYSTPTAPTVPNGGTPSNDVVIVGAAPGPVALHGVAAGVVAAGSTDAVNGSQLAATNQRIDANAAAITGLGGLVTANTTAINNLSLQVANAGPGAVRYSSAAAPTTPNGGTPSQDVTLVGAASGAVGLHNVAAGSLAAGSSDAVNGGQLASTNAAVAAVQGTAGQALALGQNAVQYDAGRASVTLNPGGAAASLRNVAAGTAASDAVNVAQLNSGLTDIAARSMTYTDQRLASVSFDLRNVRRDSDAGSATALAAAGLPQAFTPGAGMIVLGGGTYGSESAFAIGFSKAFSDGHTIVKLAGSRDTRGRTGASGGIGYQF